MQRFRKWIVTGLLIWIPVGVTIFVLRFLINLMDRTLLLIPHDFRPDVLLGYRIPGLGIILAILVLLITGMLFANLLGHKIVKFWEGLLNRIPIVRSVYKGSKQVAETLLSSDSKSFRKVVLIRWPHRDSRALAFITGSDLGEVQEKTAEDVVSVFLPTTPNPTSGFILMVPRHDVIELEMTVDEAFKMIVSLGVVVPDWPRLSAQQALQLAEKSGKN